jgi:hypothetical protein
VDRAPAGGMYERRILGNTDCVLYCGPFLLRIRKKGVVMKGWGCGGKRYLS